MIVGISIREFAKRDGCNDKLVRRAIEEGRLTALPDGKMDPALVGSGWRKSNRREEPRPKAPTATPEPSPRAASAVTCEKPYEAQPLDAPGEGSTAADIERFIESKFPMLSQAEAEKMKENYLALLRQLEYDQKSGLVVRIEDVVAEVAKKFATVRTRLLAIPAEQAPKLHRLKTVAEVQDALQEIITRALEELTSGDVVGI